MAMMMGEAPVDNVLCTDLEASRVLVVENQRQQYVPSLKGHDLDFDDDHIDFVILSIIIVITISPSICFQRQN